MRFGRGIGATFLFVLGGVAPSLGQTNPLTVEDCIRLALRAPSAVTLAQQDIRSASYGVTAARSALLPQAQWGNGFVYNSPPLTGSQGITGTVGGTPGTQNIGSFVALNGIREYQSLVSTTLEIDTSGRLRAALARARANQEIASADLAIAQRDLKRAVAVAYYQLLLARLLVKANQDVLTEAQAFADRTRTLSEAGEVARADMVKANSQVAFFRQTLDSAQLDEKVANANLASFWTDVVDQDLPLAGQLENPPKPPEEAVSIPKPYLRRFEFNLLDAQEKGFRADYRNEIAQLLPQLSFTFEYGIDANRVAWRDRGYAFLASLNVPVFDWFRAHSLAVAARTQAEQVETNREITQRSFSRDYQIALMRVRQLYGQIGLTEDQVKTSEENLNMAHIRYEGGEGPALDVVAAQTQLAQARSNYGVALAGYANALADLEVTSGR